MIVVNPKTKQRAKMSWPDENILIFLSKLGNLVYTNLIFMIQKELKAVEAFHNAFKIGCANQPTVDLPDNILDLRFRLMEEENLEYLEAAKNKDMIEVADALGDMLYILCGTILTHGMQHKIEEVFDEIQRSNMSKLGVGGAPIYREDGKVMKGPNYFKPNIDKILKQ